MQGMKSGLLLLLPPLALAGNHGTSRCRGQHAFSGPDNGELLPRRSRRSADDGQSGADQQ